MTDHPTPNKPIVEVRDLRTQFTVTKGLFSGKTGTLKAVDGVSFDVPRGGTLGLVGESGCGKTTTGRSILRLIPATSGSVRFDGVDLFTLGRDRLREKRRDMQIVFQDPVGSLNPRMTAGAIVAEPLEVHRVARGQDLQDRVASLLTRVGLDPSDTRRYPHEFSGGQRQRIGIARAIALGPKFIVCDEPVSALDVSIQSQILNLLADLQAESNLSYLFISHDLAVVRHFCDLVAVMYLGKIVETASAEQVCTHPRHPYTKALLRAVPEPDPTRRKRSLPLTGEVPNPIDPPSGCTFHTRCPFADAQCRQAVPDLETKPDLDASHTVACHYADQELELPDP
jgi:peptide/nickel transport system ATP-binding protein